MISYCLQQIWHIGCAFFQLYVLVSSYLDPKLRIRSLVPVVWKRSTKWYSFAPSTGVVVSITTMHRETAWKHFLISYNAVKPRLFTKQNWRSHYICQSLEITHFICDASIVINPDSYTATASLTYTVIQCGCRISARKLLQASSCECRWKTRK